MIVVFEKKYLEDLFEEGKSLDKKHRFPDRIIKKYCLRVQTLQSAPNIQALFPLKSLNYEVLSGNKEGISSVRIDLKYRLEFIVSKEKDTMLTICNIIDITNHYE